MRSHIESLLVGGMLLFRLPYAFGFVIVSSILSSKGWTFVPVRPFRILHQYLPPKSASEGGDA